MHEDTLKKGTTVKKLTEKVVASCWISTPSISRSAVVFCSPFRPIRSSALS